MFRVGAARAWRLGVILLLGCSENLPDDQLFTSAHFRYHARAGAALDPAIVDRLEAHRTEMGGLLGVAPGIIDYYLFPDFADLVANSPCPKPCVDGRSVMAIARVHEHELIHAYLADTNELAPPVLAEGAAQYAACLDPRFAPLTPVEEWSVAFGPGSSGTFAGSPPDHAYLVGQRLTSWMMATGGKERFIQFYRQALSTVDAALFALQFERFWGRRLRDVVVESREPRYGGSVCPCTAPPLLADGLVTELSAIEEYRTVDIGEEVRLDLVNGGGQMMYPYLCANGAVGGPVLPFHDRQDIPSTTIARLGAGRYGVAAAYPARRPAFVRMNQQPASDWSIEAAAANPVALVGRAVTVWVGQDREGPTWVVFDVVGPTLLNVLTSDTAFRLCQFSEGFGNGFPPGCIDNTNTAGWSDTPIPPPITGKLILLLGRSEGAPPTSLGVRLRPAP